MDKILCKSLNPLVHNVENSFRKQQLDHTKIFEAMKLSLQLSKRHGTPSGSERVGDFVLQVFSRLKEDHYSVNLGHLKIV